VIQQQILPILLSAAPFNSKVEDFKQWISRIEASLVKLKGEAQDKPSEMDSN
jgi:hypothetical protein